jgi:hypothetical protein
LEGENKMEVTAKDILNLTCAVKITQTSYKNGYSIFTKGTMDGIGSALQEAIDKYREQLKESGKE